ncbi:hypothetical protein CYPRO_2673 [Cyclonatronum proteinivorum]|uniref:Uncharacterized protein n=1 Tax=Cyclonatronum proteinivorum TaxID=1457365 RepID=A0A345UN63_9BACT|nr:hypothetical protein CYPRO_2673 [Cyclonatronum proteinivorum]
MSIREKTFQNRLRASCLVWSERLQERLATGYLANYRNNQAEKVFDSGRYFRFNLFAQFTYFGKSGIHLPLAPFFSFCDYNNTYSSSQRYKATVSCPG